MYLCVKYISILRVLSTVFSFHTNVTTAQIFFVRFRRNVRSVISLLERIKRVFKLRARKLRFNHLTRFLCENQIRIEYHFFPRARFFLPNASIRRCIREKCVFFPNLIHKNKKSFSVWMLLNNSQSGRACTTCLVCFNCIIYVRGHEHEVYRWKSKIELYAFRVPITRDPPRR